MEAGAFLSIVALPTWLKGILIRRRLSVRLAAALQLDGAAVRQIAGLRRRHGEGPLVMNLFGRRQALVLAPSDVRLVLSQTPYPFSPASREKKAALSHFEPENVLISEGHERRLRRRLHEAALESEQPVHSLAGRFAPLVDAAADQLLSRRRIDWPAFEDAWHPMAREVVLGSAARDDVELAKMLNALRRRANWAFTMPKRKALRARFLQRIQSYVDAAEPGSLAAKMAALSTSPQAKPADQVAQWLFAFEPAGIATFRALAALATHPDALSLALMESRRPLGDQPFLKASIIESVRLWPTTPAILRQAAQATTWFGGELPAGTGFLIFTPFLNRDPERLPFANRFAPEQWLDHDPSENGAQAPFSAGPAKCPARHLVPVLSAGLVASLLRRAAVTLERGPRMSPYRPLPATLSHFGLVIAFE